MAGPDVCGRSINKDPLDIATLLSRDEAAFVVARYIGMPFALHAWPGPCEMRNQTHTICFLRIGTTCSISSELFHNTAILCP